MSVRYTKTEVGRAEIRARVHALTRTARNLLLIIDPSRDGDTWLGLVQGAGAADLRTLLDAGLVAPVGAVAPATHPAAGTLPGSGTDPAFVGRGMGAHGPRASGPGASNGPSAANAANVSNGSHAAPHAPQGPAALSYSELYDLLPGLAKQHLGLIKGYRFVLAIERAEGLAGLRELAGELVDAVEAARGAAVSQSLRRALLLP